MKLADQREQEAVKVNKNRDLTCLFSVVLSVGLERRLGSLIMEGVLTVTRGKVPCYFRSHSGREDVKTGIGESGEFALC